MSGKTETKVNSQLIAGLTAIALAVALMVGTVLCMKQCTAEMPGPTVLETQPSSSAPSAGSTGPTLAPNPYGPGDFAYDNGYLTCLSGASLLGVDVSEYQGQINWQKVAQSDVDFAIIRLGFRAWGASGDLHTDAYALENLQGAAQAGLQIGVYFFSQAITEEEAEEEADMVLDMLAGMKLDLPVVFDWERVSASDARTAGMTSKQLNACAMAFCSKIEEAGYEAMVYFNQDMAKRMFDLQALQDAGFDFWLAMYTNSMTYPHKIAMWQYSDGGTVPGIEGNVDLNLYFLYFSHYE